MNKAERDYKRRESNSRKLLVENSKVFKADSSKETIVRLLKSNDYDWLILKAEAQQPLCSFEEEIARSSAICFVYFKRSPQVNDLPWSEEYRTHLIYRPD